MPSPLFTDRYCLTMAESFYQDDMNDSVSFEMFIRRLPHHRRFLVVAGIGSFIWWLENLTFSGEDYEYLRDEGFDDDFCRWLFVKTAGKGKFFTGNISVIPEGTIVGPHTPIVRVTAPRIEATLIESMLLSVVNHQTMIASKAARIVQAADGRDVWDFSLRRLHGPEASIGVARASYIGGCKGTATIEAGKILGIPTTGTMAHHYVMAWGREEETQAFTNFLRKYPQNHALLIDTYDIGAGIFNAIDASIIARVPLKAVRIDSGDLDHWSRFVRRELDQREDTQQCKILVSNDLDEYAIAKLKDCPIDAYGVGTMLGTSADAPHLGGVYKLVEQHDRTPHLIMKVAGEKSTDPGVHQVWRNVKDNVDTLSLIGETGPPHSRPLLQSLVIGGKAEAPFLRECTHLEVARERLRNQLLVFPNDGYRLERSLELLGLKEELSS